MIILHAMSISLWPMPKKNGIFILGSLTIMTVVLHSFHNFVLLIQDSKYYLKALLIIFCFKISILLHIQVDLYPNEPNPPGKILQI